MTDTATLSPIGAYKYRLHAEMFGGLTDEDIKAMLLKHRKNMPYGMLQFVNNPNAIHFIDEHFQWMLDNKIITISQIFYNPNVKLLFDKYPDIFKQWRSIHRRGDEGEAYDYDNIIFYKEFDYFNHRGLIDWDGVAGSLFSLPLIKQNWRLLVATNKLHWSRLLGNSDAIEIIREHWDRILQYEPFYIHNGCILHSTINLYSLLHNTAAIDLIEPLMEMIIRDGRAQNNQYIRTLCYNKNALHLLERYWNEPIVQSSICWYALANNPNAIKLVYANWNTLDSYARVNVFKRYSQVTIGTEVILFIDQHWTDFMVAIEVDDHYGILQYFLCNPNMLLLIKKRLPELIARYPKHLGHLWMNPLFQILMNDMTAVDKELYEPLFTSNCDNINIYTNSSSDTLKVVMTTIWENYFNKYPGAFDVNNLSSGQIHEFIDIPSNPAAFYDEYEVACRAHFRKHVAAELMAHVWHPSNIHRFASLGYDPNT